jgi:hypothetical protein
VHQKKENSEAAIEAAEEDQIPFVATEAAAVVEELQSTEVDTEVEEAIEAEDMSNWMQMKSQRSTRELVEAKNQASD